MMSRSQLPYVLTLGLALGASCTSKKNFSGGTPAGKIESPKSAPVIPQAPAPVAVPAPLPPPIPLPLPDPVPPPPPVPEPIPEPPMKVIEFGADKVFRIGDGEASKESACVNELSSYELKGSTYNFQFEVLEDATKIDLSIGKLCGIDAGNMTLISLVNKDSGKVEVLEQAIPTDKASRPSPYAPFAQTSLNKGNYALTIKSKSALGISDEVARTNYPGLDHHDDFIVGNIMLTGDKLLRGQKVTTE